MSNQIVISSGAKVRSLEGVLTGTAGIVNSVPLGGANGVATLDALGKVPLSQLPASVVTYLGTWNAATNTPTLTNGVGDTGDLYICNVAGTVNFGAGPITFAAGDWVIYSGTEWQKSAGASGTVTSVALTESGDALTITGSPITTSGTINIGFAGTSGQYINGAGNLTTFPSLTGYVPYTGATANVDLGTFDLTADVITGATGSFASSGSSDTLAINHSSGSGIALNITKGGNGEGLYINKTSGSGNAATIIGTLNATTLVKNGGTSSQYLMADGSVSTGPDLTGYVTLATTQTITGSKTFSASVNNDDGLKIKLGSASNLTAGYLTFSAYSTTTPSPIRTILMIGTAAAQASLLSFQNTNSFTYDFPAATGTIALTSDLSSYVPYTGALSDVNIGNNRFYSRGLTLYTGATSFSQGFTTLNGNADGLTISLATSTTNYSNQFLFTQNVSNIYTFPNATGTIALLQGTQTFTGAKTFGLNNLIADGGILFKDNAVPSSYTTGYVSAWFNINGTKNSLGLASSVTSPVYYTYDFPNASGTLVLGTGTTNYLPKFTGASTLGDSVIQELSGNIGIGGSPSGSYKFEVTGTGRFTSNVILNNLGIGGQAIRSSSALKVIESINWVIEDNGDFGFKSNAYFNGTNNVYINTGLATRLYAGNGAFEFYTAPSGTAGATTTFTSRFFIGNTGNVGIGTSSPGDRLTIATGASTSAAVTFWANAGTSANELYVGQGSSNEAYVFNRANQHLVLGTNNTERMRITSGGELCLNTSSALGSGLFSLQGQTSVYNLISIKDTGTSYSGSNNNFIYFMNSSNGTCGSISHATATTVNYYSGPSDQRLKSNIKDVEESVLPLFDDVKLKTYNHIADEDESVVYKGFLAQEMVDKFPEAYGLDKDGYYMYNPNGYIPYLVKAIQELNAKVSALENKS